jgi:hypothetical protein
MSEILQTKLDAHIQECNRRYVEMTAELKEINGNLKNKVSYREFTWILGILIAILIGMFGWIAWSIADLQKTTASVNTSVAMIQGKLAPYSVQYKN